MKKSIMLSVAILLSISLLAQAKSTLPVTLEYNVPENLVAGEVVTTAIRIIANQDLPNLTVTASAYSGLLLISGGDNFVFSDLNRGDSREFEVAIQLDSDLGYLAIQIATTDAMNRERQSNFAIRYGNPGESIRSRMKSQNIIVDSSGQTLILMPAEVN